MMEKRNNQQISTRENLLQFLKFTMFSISAGAIEIISFTVISHLTQLSYWPKYLIALTLSVVYNFTLNRRFTFKSAKNIPLAMLLVFGFYLVFTPLSTWWGNQLSLIGWNEYIILFGTMIVNFVSEFLFTRFFVFRHSINTNELANKEKALINEKN